jgi:predicted DNA-binding protein with PD1-like motif
MKTSAHRLAAPAPFRRVSVIAAMRAVMNTPAPIPAKAALAAMPSALPTDRAVASTCEVTMQHKLISSAEEKTWAVVFESGEEVMSRLQRFCEEQELTAARFTAIGAFSAATLGYFDWNRKDYDKIPINEQVEVLSLMGDVSMYEDAPKLHAHVVLGNREGNALGGHLLEAYVRPTLEVLVVESPGHLRRCMDKESGLPLINPDA